MERTTFGNGLRLMCRQQITAGENETEEMQKGKVVLTIQDDTATEAQIVALSQDAAIIDYGLYKIVFAEEKSSVIEILVIITEDSNVYGCLLNTARY